MRSSAILLAALLLFAAASRGRGKGELRRRLPYVWMRRSSAASASRSSSPSRRRWSSRAARRHSYHTFFSGEEVVVEVYEAEPAKLKIDEPWPYDEFVYLLSGKLILTDAQGEVTEYVAGESLVVPKGFLGIWEMQEEFRELVVIEKEAYMRAEESE